MRTYHVVGNMTVPWLATQFVNVSTSLQSTSLFAVFLTASIQVLQTYLTRLIGGVAGNLFYCYHLAQLEVELYPISVR